MAHFNDFVNYVERNVFRFKENTFDSSDHLRKSKNHSK